MSIDGRWHWLVRHVHIISITIHRSIVIVEELFFFIFCQVCHLYIQFKIRPQNYIFVVIVSQQSKGKARNTHTELYLYSYITCLNRLPIAIYIGICRNTYKILRNENVEMCVQVCWNQNMEYNLKMYMEIFENVFTIVLNVCIWLCFREEPHYESYLTNIKQ